MQNSENKKVLTIIVITVIVFAVAMIGLRMWQKMNPAMSEPQSTASDEDSAVDTQVEGVVPQRTTLSGTYVDCLPLHDNFSEKVCIAGFRATDGSYYAVDFSLMSQEHPVLKNGDQFTASGVVTPIEMLSANQWREVVGRGVFSVTDSVIIK